MTQIDPVQLEQDQILADLKKRPEVQALIAKGTHQKKLSYQEFLAALPEDEFDERQVDAVYRHLIETGVQIVNQEELDGEPPARSIFDVLRRAITPQDGITSTVFQENIDVLPASPHLESMAKTQIYDRLKKVTDALSSAYGWILIDTPPNMGVLTMNALAAADFLAIAREQMAGAVRRLAARRGAAARLQAGQAGGLLVDLPDRGRRAPLAGRGAAGGRAVRGRRPGGAHVL
mgnify:CR=1 FL=1